MMIAELEDEITEDEITEDEDDDSYDTSVGRHRLIDLLVELSELDAETPLT